MSPTNMAALFCHVLCMALVIYDAQPYVNISKLHGGYLGNLLYHCIFPFIWFRAIVRAFGMNPKVFVVRVPLRSRHCWLVAICEGNPSVTGIFPSQRPVTQSFDVFFDLCLNKRLSQSRRRWSETPSRSSWRHCNVICLWFHEASVSGTVDDTSSNISLVESFLGNLCFDSKMTIPCHMNWIFITESSFISFIRRHSKVTIFAEINVVWEDLSSWKNISRDFMACLGFSSWRRHEMETFSALLALCAGNSPVPGEFPIQRPVTQSFNVFYDLHLNKRLSKQSWGWWFETLSRPFWRHCYANACPWFSFISFRRRHMSFMVSQIPWNLTVCCKANRMKTPKLSITSPLWGNAYNRWPVDSAYKSIGNVVSVSMTSCHHAETNAKGRTDTYMHQWNGTSLAQVMACRLFRAKPLPGPLGFLKYTSATQLYKNKI